MDVSADPPFVLVHFECTLLAQHPNLTVHVIGDHPALGCWNPSQSIPLHQSSSWLTRSPVSLPSGAAIEYKYILVADGQLERWEEFPGNRHAVVSGSAITLRDIFDQYPKPNPPSTSDLKHVPSEIVTDGDRQLDTASSSTALAAPANAVLVVSYILPLLISRGNDGSWEIEWNEDAITAKVQNFLGMSCKPRTRVNIAQGSPALNSPLV